MQNRLYFGRIAPVEAQGTQVDGAGWAWRYKVRIMDKHTPDKSVLPDDDLPWAQVLLPVTAGSGGANYAISPQLNVGDTVSIAYLDEDEQMPVITGILPRTDEVSNAQPSSANGYIPHTGFTDGRKRSAKTPDGESNESNASSQRTAPTRTFSNVIGDTLIPADTCDPNAYKTNAIISEINNLFNQISRTTDTAYIDSIIQGSIDRIHSLVNPYVGDLFNNVFNSLIPVLNNGLKALFEKIFAIVLASSQNPVIAQKAAEAALVGLVPAVNALQDAIQLLASEVVDDLLAKVDTLVRDAVANNQNFSQCAGTQFTAAIVNAIINDIDRGLQPLLNAVAEILTGGFAATNILRSSLDIVRDFSGGLLSVGQGANKCGGKIKEYSYGFGAVSDVGDILQEIISTANEASALVNSVDSLFDQTYGSFPILSSTNTSQSKLSGCTTAPPDTCFAPTITVFGGRGEGARARAIIGDYVSTNDARTVSQVQGGVVSIEVLDGGSGYAYPPFVDIRDNCGLGRGAQAQAVIKDGRVTRIYIVQPGVDYPAEGEELFVVDSVEVVAGGNGYDSGIVEDQFGGQYEIIADDNGTVTDVLPINIVQVPVIPTLNIPIYSPPLPPNGVFRDGCIYDARTNEVITCDVKVGRGLRVNPLLIPLPPIEDIQNDNLPGTLADRVTRSELLEIIDCVEN